jgi:hypothetical protein
MLVPILHRRHGLPGLSLLIAIFCIILPLCGIAIGAFSPSPRQRIFTTLKLNQWQNRKQLGRLDDQCFVELAEAVYRNTLWECMEFDTDYKTTLAGELQNISNSLKHSREDISYHEKISYIEVIRRFENTTRTK